MTMKGQVFQATFLVILMLLSGCFLSSDSVTEEVKNDDENVELTFIYSQSISNIADLEI